MAFYDKSKEERIKIVEEINRSAAEGIQRKDINLLTGYFSNEDTYIRKATYQAIGKLYRTSPDLDDKIISCLNVMKSHEDYRVRQTVINAAGEIGKLNFTVVESFFEKGLTDPHHSPRNAVIGSVKKMGEINPAPVLKWAEKYLNHPDQEIRREICHGIELRGRTHPQEILPLLKKLQHDPTSRVRNTLVHVIGQISYKQGCLITVLTDLKTWENVEIVESALEEILDVHERYRDFAALTVNEAEALINSNFKRNKLRK